MQSLKSFATHVRFGLDARVWVLAIGLLPVLSSTAQAQGISAGPKGSGISAGPKGSGIASGFRSQGSVGFGGIVVPTWGFGYGYGPYYGYGAPIYGPVYGYGGYYGYGSSPGVTAYDAAMMREQQYARSQARFNLTQAKAARQSQEALLTRQKAINQALRNQKLVMDEQRKYALEDAQRETQPVKPSSVLNENGRVRWPSIMPDLIKLDEQKAQLDEITMQMYQDYLDEGQSSTALAIEAKQILYPLGNSALDIVRRRSSLGNARNLEAYLNQLDGAITTMGSPLSQLNSNQ